MKKKLIRLLIAVSLMILVNCGNQTVLAAPDEVMESSEVAESTSSNETNENENKTSDTKENEVSEETPETAPENTIVVSDKLFIEPKKPHAGEQVVFNLTLPEELDFETIVLSYLASESKAEKEVTLTYDSETNSYQGHLETDSGTAVGIWQFIKAVGIDANNVSSILETTPLTDENVELRQSDFEVIPHPTSMLNLSSFKVVPKSVEVSEKLLFSMKAAENAALTNVTVVYRSLTDADGEKTNQQLTIPLSFNEETTVYEGAFTPIASELVGDWAIEYLKATDDKGNSFILYNQFLIELDKKDMQAQLNDLKKQQNEAQKLEDETKETEQVEQLNEQIRELEKLKEAKEKLLQADLSIGNFTVVENLTEEDSGTIDEEIPVIEEEESSVEKESNTPIKEPLTVKEEEAVLENKLDDMQKNNEALNDKSENKELDNVLIEAFSQTAVESSATEETEKEELSESTAFSKGYMIIVVAAFILINGFIFKF